MAELLSYASSPTYRHRRNARPYVLAKLVAIALFGVGFISVFEFMFKLTSADRWVRWFFYALTTVVCAVHSILAVAQIVRGGYWEIRIEGGQVYLTQPGQPTRVVPVQDVTHFVTLDVTRRDGHGATETTRSYELQLCGRGDRVRLHDDTFGWLRAFRQALLRENPRIRLVKEARDDDRTPALT